MHWIRRHFLSFSVKRAKYALKTFSLYSNLIEQAQKNLENKLKERLSPMNMHDILSKVANEKFIQMNTEEPNIEVLKLHEKFCFHRFFLV